MDWFGSWTAMFVMGAASLAWFGWDKHRHISTEGMDLFISIFTMLLDVLVIIGANYTRRQDRKMLKDEYKLLQEIHQHLIQKKGP